MMRRNFGRSIFRVEPPNNGGHVPPREFGPGMFWMESSDGNIEGPIRLLCEAIEQRTIELGITADNRPRILLIQDEASAFIGNRMMDSSDYRRIHEVMQDLIQLAIRGRMGTPDVPSRDSSSPDTSQEYFLDLIGRIDDVTGDGT